jgi:hypothetical protein
MELHKGSPCGALKQAKMSLFHFFLYKIEEQEGRTGPAWKGKYQGERRGGGKMVKKGEYSANTLHTCT